MKQNVEKQSQIRAIDTMQNENNEHIDQEGYINPIKETNCM